MKKDEFKERYMIKLASSILLVVLNAIVQLILPRAFTVEEYGYYTYNLNVFMSVVNIATLSTQSALVSKLSKKNEEIGLVLFYLKFYLIMAFVLNLAVIGLYISGFLQETFVGQTLFIILLGLEAAIVLRLQTDSIGIFDAMAVSRFPAIMQIIMKAVICIVVIISFFMGRLNLAWFYIIQTFLTFLITFSMLYEIIKDQKMRYPVRIDRGNRVYIKEFWKFCKPLVLSNIVSQMIVILMNWSLMKWAGVIEQAIFGAAWQLNALISYIFSPYAELSKREFAVICNDIKELKYRYIQSLKFMMWIISYFAIFTGFISGWLLPVVYGNKYAGAVPITILIMFYTVYQAWGQISGSFLLATERTKISAVLTVTGQLITFGLVFVFQVPNSIWPTGLGALGIALTYLISNILSVSISLFVNSKILNTSFWKNFSIQIFPMSLCSITVLFLKLAIDYIWTEYSTITLIGKMFVAGIVYTIVLGSTICIRPELAGITRENFKRLVRKANKKR